MSEPRPHHEPSGGEHLWATTTKFSEHYGLGHLRPARATSTDPFAKGRD